MNKQLLLPLLILFVLLDLGFTFYQSYRQRLEGDMVEIVLPAPSSQQVLSDPFGWAALVRNEVYVAPNRFFAHAAMVGYFKTMPFALQRIVDPISSIYAACALFKVFVQALMLYLLCAYASDTSRPTSLRFWVVVALLVPLFQTDGYNDQMGILDDSITYTFFYAFPLALLLLLMLPFYRSAWRQKPFQVSWPASIALVLLMVVLAFNGAIVTGAVAVLGTGIVLHWCWRQRQRLRNEPAGKKWGLIWQRIPWQPLALLAIFGTLCLYSLYIGLNELESAKHVKPLLDRYLKIPAGIYWQFRRPGLPLFVAAVLVNVYLIRKKAPAAVEGRRLQRIFLWISIFAVVYVLLLPLGGYRAYRPLIIRRDSIMPITLALMYFYAISTYYLGHNLPELARRRYFIWIGVLSAFYFFSDNTYKQGGNECERRALEILARTPQPVVQLPADCTVLSWLPITHPTASETQAQLLEYWGVTWGKRLYYQVPAK